jgi:hypothetical protein
MRVPVYTRQVGLQIGGSPPRLDVNAFAGGGAAVARGVEAIADVGADYAEALVRARRAIEIGKATAGAQRELDDLHLDLEQEGDWRNGAKRFEESAAKIAEKHAKGLSDPGLQAQFQAGFGRSVESRRVSLRRKMVDFMQADGEATVLQAIDDGARAAAGARTDLERRQAMGAVASIITDMRESRVISPVKAVTLFKDFKGKVAEAQVLSALNGARESGAMAIVERLQSGEFEGLDEVRRQRLIDTALRRAEMQQRASIAAGERNERRATTRLRELEDETAKEAASLRARGELTVEWVEANRRNLGVGQYERYRELAGSGGVVAAPPRDDVGALAQLQRNVDSKDPETFQREAMRLRQRGLIRDETFDSYVERNRAARRDDGPPSPYRAGRNLVVTALDPGNVTGVIGKYQRGAMTKARADAEADFDTWSTANPAATREQHIAKARELVVRYRQDVDEETRDNLPLPIAFQGERKNVDETAIGIAARELVLRRREGRISEAEFVREEEIISAWRGVIGRPAAPPARQPAPANSSGARGSGARVQ